MREEYVPITRSLEGTVVELVYNGRERNPPNVVAKNINRHPEMTE